MLHSTGEQLIFLTLFTKWLFYFFFFLFVIIVLDTVSVTMSHWNCRSSHWRCSVKIGVVKNLGKFTRKHLCQSLFFNKVAGLRLATLLKNKLWHRFFLRTSFLQNTPRRLLLRVVYAKNKQVKLFLILNRKLSTAGNVFTKPLHYRCRRSPSELS